MNKLRTPLLVVFGLIIAFLVWMLLDNQARLSSFRNQVQKLKNGEQEFQETISNQGEKIATQEALILNQKDAIAMNLMQISNLKKIKSQVKTVVETKIDSVFIGFKDTLLEKDTIIPSGTINVPKRFFQEDEFTTIGGVIILDGLLLDSLEFRNEITVTIGEKSQGLFRATLPMVEIQNTNPHIQTLSMNNVIIKKDKKFYEKKVFWFGLGLVGGIVLMNK